jgi:hypothetical protein
LMAFLLIFRLLAYFFDFVVDCWRVSTLC